MTDPLDDPWSDPRDDWADDPSPLEDRASWQQLDLTGILDGSWKPPQPTMLTRSDGVPLIYPGLTHSFHGESESGKSLLAQWLTAQLLAEGKRVAYLDYESDPGSVVHRLLMLGATREQIAAGLYYAQPEVGPRQNTAELRAWVALNRLPFALVVIDGVTAALVASQLESKDNDQVTRWSREQPEHLARNTGAGVVMIDHVPKDSQTRGRFAIGAQAKLGRITGAAYHLEPKRALGEGLRGLVAVRLVKDRPGQLRRHTGPVRWEDRSAEIARFVLDSTQVTTRAYLDPPADDASGPLRPTAIMENISKWLETATEPKSQTQIEQQACPGNAGHKRAALDLLVAEGHVARNPGKRGAHMHQSTKPYRQADDPRSDMFTGQSALTA